VALHWPHVSSVLDCRTLWASIRGSGNARKMTTEGKVIWQNTMTDGRAHVMLAALGLCIANSRAQRRPRAGVL